MEEIKNSISGLKSNVQQAKETPEQTHLDKALVHLKEIEEKIGDNAELKTQLDQAKQAIRQSQSFLNERSHSPKDYEESIEETIDVCNRVDYPLCY